MSDAAVALPFVAPAVSADPVQARRQRGVAIASVTRITRAKGNEDAGSSRHRRAAGTTPSS